MRNAPTTIAEAARELRSGHLSSVDLVEHSLDRIRRFNPVWGAVISSADDTAVAAAEHADRELADGIDRGPLHGIPVGLKDILATRDLPTTAQSEAMPDGFQGYDAAAAARLRESGAIILAKASCSEFACGPADSSRAFPLPKNPWDSERVTSGSSGGSANGLHAGFFLGAVGTDTGGSIRGPSAYCGITGLKPTRGLISRFGCVPLSTTSDHIGPMARTAYDAALMLSAMTGSDSRDEASASEADAGIDFAKSLDGDLSGMVIGIDHAAHELVDAPSDILDLFSAALEKFKEAGARIVDLPLPFLSELHAASHIVLSCEAFDAHRENLRAVWTDYGAKTRIFLASGASISGADYVRAQRIVAKARSRYRELLEHVDGVATITLPSVAPRADDDAELTRVKAGALLTSRWNSLGMPALSVPMGMLPAGGAPQGLPVGLQLAGKPFADAQLLKIADAYQRRTPWHELVSPAQAQS